MAKGDDDTLKDAKEAFRLAEERESENRRDALDDIKFAQLSDQWPANIRRDRELDGRPCLTINKLPSFIRQVVNDARQNKPAIEVHPVDSEADVETAEIFAGLIRQIEVSSDSEVAYDRALESAVTMGRGFFKINTRYAHDDTFDQDIVIESVPNPLSIYGDPDSTAADSSDWMTAFELDTMPVAKFKDRFGKDAEAASFSTDDLDKTATDEQVTIAAWWTREDAKRTIVMLSPPQVEPSPDQMAQAMAIGAGEIVDLSVYEANKALFDSLGVTVVAKRDVPAYKVKQRLISGAEVLETVDWKGKFIPIVPVYGVDVNVEGKRYWRSMIRDVKDAQRMFNYWRTTTTELVALAPKAPFIGRKGTFDTDAAKWATANTQTHAYIEFDTEMPQRQPFAGVPAGALQEALNAADDMKAVMGLYDASLGARSNETSGKAIMARQREGDTSTFHYIDNLSRAIRHAGRILIDLIPQVYSVPRIERIIGKEGQETPVLLAPKADHENLPQGMQPPVEERETPQGEMEEITHLYALDVGRYDVTTKAGPSFNSRREEFVTMATELIRALPAAAPLLIDKIIENYDLPGGEELAERFKAMLPGPAQGNNPQVQEARQIAQQLQQELAKCQQQLNQAQADKSIEGEKLALERMGLAIEAFKAETDRMEAEGRLAGQMNPQPDEIPGAQAA